MSTAQTEHDPVSKPRHYTSGASEIGRPALKHLWFTEDDFQLECLEALHKDNHQWILRDAFVFFVVRYLWRAGLKSDNAKQDLDKALFYLNLAIIDEAEQRSVIRKLRLDEVKALVNKARFGA
jgi:hypothetical protein